jgi:hypothetical protein
MRGERQAQRLDSFAVDQRCVDQMLIRKKGDSRGNASIRRQAHGASRCQQVDGSAIATWLGEDMLIMFSDFFRKLKISSVHHFAPRLAVQVDDCLPRRHSLRPLRSEYACISQTDLSV